MIMFDAESDTSLLVLYDGLPFCICLSLYCYFENYPVLLYFWNTCTKQGFGWYSRQLVSSVSHLDSKSECGSGAKRPSKLCNISVIKQRRLMNALLRIPGQLSASGYIIIVSCISISVIILGSRLRMTTSHRHCYLLL